MPFEGTCTSTVTPCRRGFAINRDAFAAAGDQLVMPGVRSVVVAGATRQYYAQTPDERFQRMGAARASMPTTNIELKTIGIDLSDAGPEENVG
jgi:dihydrodipicolinate synthase/N-acetylneuraminate lyase